MGVVSACNEIIKSGAQCVASKKGTLSLTSFPEFNRRSDSFQWLMRPSLSPLSKGQSEFIWDGNAQFAGINEVRLRPQVQPRAWPARSPGAGGRKRLL